MDTKQITWSNQTSLPGFLFFRVHKTRDPGNKVGQKSFTLYKRLLKQFCSYSNELEIL